MPDEVPADLLDRHAAGLRAIEQILESWEIETRLLERSEELPFPTLLVAFETDDRGRDRTLGVSFLPFAEDALETSDLVQFYVRLPFEVPSDRLDEVLAASTLVNGELAIGHFGVRGTELYYRYVLATLQDAPPAEPLLHELLPILAFHQEHFGAFLEQVVDGEVARSDLPATLEADEG